MHVSGFFHDVGFILSFPKNFMVIKDESPHLKEEVFPTGKMSFVRNRKKYLNTIE